jgi:hypothetical protein
MMFSAQCYAAGRVDDAFGYLEGSQQLTDSGGFDQDLYETQTSTRIAYMARAGKAWGSVRELRNGRPPAAWCR